MKVASIDTHHWVSGEPGSSATTAQVQTLKDILVTKGVKFDTEKPRMDLVPPLALIETSKVLGYGARKYSADNWRKVDGKEWRYFGAAQRHLWAYKSGQKYDPETGINHLAHAMCSILFLLELDLEAEA